MANGLSDFLERCNETPNAVAIIDGNGQSITFGALASQSATLAQGWRKRGLNQGDRVLLAMPFGIPLYVALAALWRCGAVVVLPEPAMGLAGVRHAARTAGPSWTLFAGLLRVLRLIIPDLWWKPSLPNSASTRKKDVGGFENAPLHNDDPAIISFTSGSTGTPKGMIRTHGLLAAQNQGVLDILTADQGPSVDLIAFPVFVLANLALGNTTVLPGWSVRRHDRADADAILDQVKRHEIKRLMVPPIVCETVVPLVEAMGLQKMITGGAPVFPDLVQRLRAADPNLDVVSVYGSTEAEPIAHTHASHILENDWKAMSDGAGLLAGPPSPMARVKIIGSEITVTGEHVNKGYMDASHDASTKLTIDGEVWHRTGDAGRFDDDGRLWLLGRLKGRCGDLYPFSVETATRFWPGVKRSALFEMDGDATLAIEGDATHLEDWQKQARDIGKISVVHVSAIPLDRRHRSKVDYGRLEHLLSSR